MTRTNQLLDDKMIALYKASLELVADVSIDSLLERIAAVACQQANAQFSALATTDNNGNIVKFIVVGISDEQIARISHNPVGLGLLRETYNSKAPIRVSHIHQDQRSVGFPEHHPSMNSFLGVPILVGDKPVGQLYLTNKLNGTEFTSEDEQIIQLLATYAATAIKNATYIEELQIKDMMLTRQTQDLALLNNIGESLTTSIESDEVLQNTLALVISHLNVEAGEIFLLDDGGTTLELAMHRGAAAEVFWSRNKFAVGEGIIGQVAKNGKPIISFDLSSDERFLRSAIVAAGFRQMAAFPLTSRGKVIGVLAAFTQSRNQINERDQKIISSICNWAGITLENTRLQNNARRLAILEERDRIGMDLHDGIIQEIYGVGLMLEHARLDIRTEPERSASQIQAAINTLNRTIRDIRSYILDLKPRELGEENLLEGIKRLVTEFKVNTLSEAILSGQPKDLTHLPQKISLTLFLICQEALANIAKHARAKKVTVSIWTTPGRVMLEITDNGVGFDVDKMSQSLGHGLSNMHTRAKQVGGEIEITSSVGAGTSLLIWVPRRLPE